MRRPGVAALALASTRSLCTRAPPSPTRAGKVHFQLPEGSVLAPGQLIARLDLDDPAAVRRCGPAVTGRPCGAVALWWLAGWRCDGGGLFPSFAASRLRTGRLKLGWTAGGPRQRCSALPQPHLMTFPRAGTSRSPPARAEPFTGAFPELGPPVVEGEGVAARYKAALEGAANILAGYHNDPDAGAAGVGRRAPGPGLRAWARAGAWPGLGACGGRVQLWGDAASRACPPACPHGTASRARPPSPTHPPTHPAPPRSHGRPAVQPGRPRPGPGPVERGLRGGGGPPARPAGPAAGGRRRRVGDGD